MVKRGQAIGADGRLLARAVHSALGSPCTRRMLNIKAPRGHHTTAVCMPTPSCMEESFALVLPTEGSLAPPPVAGCT